MNSDENMKAETSENSSQLSKDNVDLVIESSASKFPNWDILPPHQIINPRIKVN